VSPSRVRRLAPTPTRGSRPWLITFALPGLSDCASAEVERREGRMWQRFTERSRRGVFFAQEEAARLGENYVGTEHLLLGLVREKDHVGARILQRLGVSQS